MGKFVFAVSSDGPIAAPDAHYSQQEQKVLILLLGFLNRWTTAWHDSDSERVPHDRDGRLGAGPTGERC